MCRTLKNKSNCGTVIMPPIGNASEVPAAPGPSIASHHGSVNVSPRFHREHTCKGEALMAIEETCGKNDQGFFNGQTRLSHESYDDSQHYRNSNQGDHRYRHSETHLPCRL